MLTKTQKNLTLIFAVLLVLELVCIEVESLANWHYLSKPSLVVALMIFFWLDSSEMNARLRNISMLALFFSLVGDILLMFVEQSPHFFTLGLVGFLIAHVFYIIAFNTPKNTSKTFGFLSVLLLFYAITLFSIVKNGLGGMMIPVIIYMVVILTMAQMSFWRRSKANGLSFYLVFIGALFFLVSDSLIALNKFYKPFQYSGTAIMLTYGIAQYLIVMGLLKQDN